MEKWKGEKMKGWKGEKGERVKRGKNERGKGERIFDDENTACIVNFMGM